MTLYQPEPDLGFTTAAATAIGMALGDALVAPPLETALAFANEFALVRRSNPPVVSEILARTAALVALPKALIIRGRQRVEARLPEHGFPRYETSHGGMGVVVSKTVDVLAT